MMANKTWDDTKQRCLSRIRGLRKLFALSLEGLSRIERELSPFQTSDWIGRESSRPFLCRDSFAADVLIWEPTVGEVQSALGPALQQFLCMVTMEWVACVEEFLRQAVSTLLASGADPDPQKMRRRVFESSAKWQPEIARIFGIDISNYELPWHAIREWIEIRHCIVHRGGKVDQVFLDRLRDVAKDIEYRYEIGNDFNLMDGELYQLLWATELMFVGLAEDIDRRVGKQKKPSSAYIGRAPIRVPPFAHGFYSALGEAAVSEKRGRESFLTQL